MVPNTPRASAPTSTYAEVAQLLHSFSQLELTVGLTVANRGSDD